MIWNKEIQGIQALEAVTAISALILFFSLYRPSFWFIFLGAFLLILSRMSIYYLKHVSDQLVFDNEKKTLRISIGEETLLGLKISQLSRLPVFQASLRVRLQACVTGAGFPSKMKGDEVEFTVPLHLKGKEAILVSIPVKGLTRGATRIKSLELTVENFFGIGSVELKYNPYIHKEVLIYPTPMPVSMKRLTSVKSNGDYTVRNSLHEEFLAPVGTRDYVYTDSFKQIHWKASAKVHTLQTKVFEHKADYSWTFIVNFRDPDVRHGLGIIENIESTAANIAFLAQYAAKQFIPYEVFLNLRVGNQSSVYHLPKGEGPRQLAKVLDLLSRIGRIGITLPIGKFLHSVEKQQQNSPVVIICGSFVNLDEPYFLKMQKNRQRIFLLQDGLENASILPLGKA